MKVTQIPFQKTGFFSKTMADYLEQKATINPFYHNYPDLNGFQKQLEEKDCFFYKRAQKSIGSCFAKAIR